jgi:hypothetical protein
MVKLTSQFSYFDSREEAVCDAQRNIVYRQVFDIDADLAVACAC